MGPISSDKLSSSTPERPISIGGGVSAKPCGEGWFTCSDFSACYAAQESHYTVTVL